MEDIQKLDWGQITPLNFPFSDYEYLLALETSQSVGSETGWIPHYLTVWQGVELVGATFVYLKTNSYGEYIFDWEWADAYHRCALPYYPKLVSAIPFTPATGAKILLHPNADRDAVSRALISAMLALAEEKGCHSVNCLFLPPEEVPHFSERGFLIRHSFQYHWFNREYVDFSDFLDHLKTKRKKQIVREREQLIARGLEIRVVTGEAIRPRHAGIMYRFYLSTIDKMGAYPYLTSRFFDTVMATMKDRLVLILAYDRGTEIAGTINYRKGDHLYGRYWGADEYVRHLHFELCYYQSIDYAIRNKITLFEAGAQGEHKFPRGFLPERNYSAHWIFHARFRTAIAQFINEEKALIGRLIDDKLGSSPYHQQIPGSGRVSTD